MAVLVTGCAGFIGSHLIPELRARTPVPIIGIDNFNDYYDPRWKEASARKLSNIADFSLERIDFCDFAAVQQLFHRHQFDTVIHLGAYAGVRYSVDHPGIYQRANIEGTLALLEGARHYPVRRFLFASSSTVYGNGSAVPFQEDSPLGVPASPYGVSKRAAELLGLNYFFLHQVPFVILRLFSVYGPRLRPDLALSIFASAILSGRPIPLYGDGSIRRDYTHVSDIVDGILAAKEAPEVAGQAFNLGHNEPAEMRYIIQLLEEGLGKSAQVDRQPARAEDLPVTCADLTKSRRMLGYDPRMSLEEGIRQYCAWFRNFHQTGGET